MKTLILAINAKHTHSALAPWYLKAAVREANASAPPNRGISEPEIWETNVNVPAKEILAEIRARKPMILAISCYIWNITLVGELLAEINRKSAECIVILGGPEVSFNAVERLEEFRRAHFVICGEGEESFVRILNRMSGNTGRPEMAWEDIPGLVWRDKGKIRQNPIREIESDPPDPYLPEYLEGINGRLAYLETSRGCPFSCSFCLSGLETGVRFFDLERAKRNLLKLAGSGAKTVKLVDRTFNCHPERSREIFRFLLESRASGAIPPGVCFHFEVAADLFDRETIEMLRGAPAGLFQLEIGVQSFYKKALKAVRRVTDLDAVRENVRLLRENNNIHLHLDLIAGLPYESYKSFGGSFNKAFALAPHMLQMGFLKLLPGSRLWERNFGFIANWDPPYQIRYTAWIDSYEMADLALCVDALDRLYNSGRFPLSLRYLLDACGMKPFAFFSAVGAFIGKSTGRALEAYIADLIRFAESIPGVDSEILRDRLVMDWLQTNRVGVLPRCLSKPDPVMKKVGGKLAQSFKAPPRMREDPDSRAAPDTRRRYGYALLYGEGKTRVVVADYREPRPRLGNYPLMIVDLDRIFDLPLLRDAIVLTERRFKTFKKANISR